MQAAALAAAAANKQNNCISSRLEILNLHFYYYNIFLSLQVYSIGLHCNFNLIQHTTSFKSRSFFRRKINFFNHFLRFFNSPEYFYFFFMLSLYSSTP
jgi:hypothetical protein